IAMSTSNRYKLLYGIFVLSGFAGLIYESIWAHYLKLFLGHAAYAQALVLSIFMGGMAIGAWITGKGKILYGRINQFYAYAVVELLIGISGLLFHGTFRFLTDFSIDHIIPFLADPGLVHLYKWGIGSLLILPQSILLGATFPLMTNGLLRIHPELPGRSISLLYFGNSIGAAAGVLVAGFFLIAWSGMPGTIMTAAIINILIAIAVYVIAKNLHVTVAPPVPMKHKEIPHLMLAASFLTGMASFIYELVWVRMLSMVLGATTHSFELMLSAFITGLAFGGLWIRNRIDRTGNPVSYAGVVQILMGLAAFSTLILYNHTFDIMGFLVRALAKNNDGYFLFLLGSHAIALLVMLPATFLAGMTLPLFTLILLRSDYGEKSISHIYLFNMLGAVSGVIFISFIGMSVLGIKGSLFAGCAIDLILGIVLLMRAGVGPVCARAFIMASLAMFMVIFYVAEIDPRRLATNVYRTGLAEIPVDRKVLFYKDGKTSTVTMTRTRDNLQTISTNGKPDGSIFMDDRIRDRSFSDEATQVLLGAIPLAIYPEARKVAVIGIGTGLTSHVVLSWPDVERLDTVEIEGAMIEGARRFRPRNERVFTDPRSFLHVEDARTFFPLTGEKYDLIISEPSNPWVSGVSSLFSGEFYRQIRNSLQEDGYLIQWMQIYEMDTDLFLSVLKAISKYFSDYRIYATKDNDLAIVARPQGRVSNAQDDIFTRESMRKELAVVSISHVDDIHARYLADRRLLEPLTSSPAIKANSDYYPLLDLYAPRASFLNETVTFLKEMRNSPVPVARMFLQPDYTDGMILTPSPSYT
ncbi:MAG: fused MFS/spermidine synthase, partial [Gammaproteobacteria bacterium]